MIFSNVDLTQKKQNLRNTYSDYESLLNHAAQLLNHSEELSSQIIELMLVFVALKDDGIETPFSVTSLDGAENRITFAEGVLRAYANVGNELSKVALETIYPSTQKGRKFKPNRPRGAKSDSTKHIEKLVKSNPNLSAKELERLANKNIIGDIKSGTFANKVSAIKNQNN